MNFTTDIDLPSLPKTGARIIQLCSDPKCDLGQLVEAVRTDGALTAKFLKLANAPFYGQHYEVATLRRAAVVLGLKQVKVVALAFQLAKMSQQWTGLPIDLEVCWLGSLLRACTARQLALATPVANAKCPEEAFLVGLLQDFAVPMLAQEIGATYRDHVRADGMATDEDTVRLETESVGSNHAHLAGAIFDRWRFPPVLTFAITNHHLPPQSEPATDKAMGLWQLAYWVGAVPFREDGRSAAIAVTLRTLASSAFGLDVDALGIAFYRAIEDFERMSAVFDDMLPSDLDGSNLFAKAQALLAGIDEEENPDRLDGADA
ncbi:MAG: HDOD domain-containing protein [Phycisphaerae bacterium]